mgnify:CR=1 FL=1
MVVAGDRAAEAGIEPTRRRSERLILPLDDSAVSVLQAAHPTVARGEGFEPSPSASKAGGLPLADPRIQVPIVSSALRESNPPCQVGSLGPLPLGQGHVHGKRKERESNPQGSSPTAFKAAAIASWLVLPEGCGGRNRTCDVTLNRRPPVPTQAPPHHANKVRTAGIQVGALVLPWRAPAPDFPTSCFPQSAQRESNPHVRHGKATGCRYIMGALWRFGLSKNWLVVAPRVELGATRLSAGFGQPALDYRRSTSLLSKVGMAGLEPAVLCSQNTWVGRYPTSRYVLDAGRSKLSTDPCGNRTRLPGLKGRCPVPIDERAVCSARTFHARRHRRAHFTQWVGRCSNPRLRLFRPPLDRLSYRPNEKSPASW